MASPATGNQYMFINAFSLTAMDLAGTATYGGSLAVTGETAHLNDGKDPTSQIWRLDNPKINGNDTYYTITNMKNTGLVLDVYGGQTGSGTPLIGFRDHTGTNQKWLLQKNPDSKAPVYRLLPLFDGKGNLAACLPNGSSSPGTQITSNTTSGSTVNDFTSWLLVRMDG